MALMQQNAIDSYGAQMFAAHPEVAEEVVWLDHNSIAPNSDQPRRYFDTQAQRELEKSVRESGIEQPIIVRRQPAKYRPEVVQYQLISGERRWRAAGEVGLERVPCIIRDVDARTAYLSSVRENVQRQSLRAVEEVEAVEYMREKLRMTGPQILKAMGQTEGWLSNRVSTLKAPTFIRKIVEDYPQTIGLVPIIRSVDDEAQQRRMVRMVHDNPAKVTAEALRQEARRWKAEQEEAQRRAEARRAPLPASSMAMPVELAQGTVPRIGVMVERGTPEDAAGRMEEMEAAPVELTAENAKWVEDVKAIAQERHLRLQGVETVPLPAASPASVAWDAIAALVRSEPDDLDEALREVARLSAGWR